MDLKLKGKRALVTGSTAGIGAAIAGDLAREEARVIVNGRAAADVDKAVAMLKAESGGDLVGFAGDLGTAAPIEKLVRRHPGCGLDAVLRSQCVERGAPRPRVFAGDEARQLGPDPLHLERERAADPS